MKGKAAALSVRAQRCQSHYYSTTPRTFPCAVPVSFCTAKYCHRWGCNCGKIQAAFRRRLKLTSEQLAVMLGRITRSDQRNIDMYSGLGPGRVVGIATGYGLDGPRIESQWGPRLSAPVQTGPRAHPASFTMGTGSFHEERVAGV